MKTGSATTGQRVIYVNVLAMNGEEVLSNFGFPTSAKIEELAVAVEEVMKPTPGKRCRLYSNGTALDHSNSVGNVADSFLLDGSTIMTVIDTDPTVLRMMELLKQTADYVREHDPAAIPAP